MSSTLMSNERTNPVAQTEKVDMKLEVVVVPVSDVERAKQFYLGMGWRVDADFASGDGWRLAQITPPGSACSFFIGKGITKAAPGSAQGMLLMVDNVDAARADLIAHGIEVQETFHFDHDLIQFTGTQGRVPGPDPQRRSYLTFASFNDPDGNGWVLQEITTRIPGRGFSSMDVATLTALLKETEEHHGEYEPTAPKHHWSDWYAAYIVARQRGRNPEEAVKDSGLHMESIRR